DGEEELALCGARLPELPRHVVEGRGELAELAHALDRNRSRGVLLGEAASRGGDAPHGPRDRTGQQERAERRQRGARERGREQANEERSRGRGAELRRTEEDERLASYLARCEEVADAVD